MEDAFKFLLVAAVIVIGLVRQFKKEAKKNAGNKPDMPIPDTNMDDEMYPSDQENTYGGYIPEGPQALGESAEQIFVRPVKPKSSKSTTSSYTPTKPQNSPLVSDTQESDEPSEYGIHSAEEARRAIIWSEILQRKY